VVGENPAVLEQESVKALFERAMRSQAGTDLAFYPAESVVGRLRTGIIRTGDVYNLESWQDSVATLEIRGDGMRGELLEQLRAAAGAVDPDRVYSVATTGYVARERASDLIGSVGSWQRGAKLRDVTIAHLKEHGFS
jgi:hypothetical protein